MITPRFEQLRLALAQDGLDGGLKFLNATTEHRYTAVYRLRHSLLKNVGLYDKAGEIRPEFLAEVPLESSFCQFVLRDGQFLTSDSSTDDRLDGHPYKGVMMAYTGVPLRDDQGEFFGTLCHFDLVQRPLSPENFELLQQGAKLISPLLPASP
jgi:GAF domain-containing protein